MNKLQRGFALVESLLVILIIAVIGLGGYYAWHTHHKTNSSNKAAVSQTAPAKKATAPTQKYLVIKEWGVKVPISGAISGAYYVASTSSQDSKGQPNIMWLGVRSLDAEPGCNATTANEGRGVSIGSLTRTSPGEIDPVTGETFDQATSHGINVGGYYYSVLLAQASCNQDPKNDTLLTSVRTAFTDAGTKIVKE